MEIGWILGGLFSIVTLVFIAIALMAPEWVGIQGRVARKIEESHRQQQDPDKESEDKKTPQT